MCVCVCVCIFLLSHSILLSTNTNANPNYDHRTTNDNNTTTNINNTNTNNNTNPNTKGMEKPNKDALVQDIELVAFHEAGHAIVGGLMPEYDTVTKISIVPRVSGAGGLTFFSPLEDRLDNVVTLHYLESQLAVAWGGRVAEELVFGPSKVTTGASGDLQQIFRIARAMVTELGMSRLPPLNYDFQSRGDGDVDWQLSGWLKERINSEILRLASNGYYTAKEILMQNEDLLWETARRLVQVLHMYCLVIISYVFVRKCSS